MKSNYGVRFNSAGGAELFITPSDNLFGDPLSGQTKTFALAYRFANGIPQLAVSREEVETVGSSTASSPQAENWAGDYVIYAAYYFTRDVTSLVVAMVRSGVYTIPALDGSLGGDPAVGTYKVLTILYRNPSGVYRLRAICEFGQIQLT